MSSDPKISVVMITYNHEKYIVEAIDSILAQTYSDFELIIVDDGSNDNTLNIIRGYDDQRIIIVAQENYGPSIALNTGMNKSRGEFVAFMSGDDVSFSDRLAAQLEQIEMQKADILFCLPQIIGPDSKILPNRVCRMFFDHEFDSTAELYRQLFDNGNFLCAPTCFCRRTAIKKVGQFKRGIIQLQDFDYWIRACKNNLVIKLSKYPLLQYRFLFGSNLSGTSNVDRISLESTMLYRSFFDGAPAELLRNSFSQRITIDAFEYERDLEVDKSLLFLTHSSSAIKAIGIERIIHQFDDEITYKILTTERGFSTSKLFQFEKTVKLGSESYLRKLKTGLILIRNYLLRYISLIISEGPVWTETQIEQRIQHYLDYGDNNRAILLAYLYKRIPPGPTVFMSIYSLLGRILRKFSGLFGNVLEKIKRMRAPSLSVERVWVLSKMYDYAKLTNSIIFEETPEKFTLKRPLVIGNIAAGLYEGEVSCPLPYVSQVENATIIGGSSLVVSGLTGELLNDEMVDFSTKDFGVKAPYVNFRHNNKVIMGYKKKLNTDLKEGILLSCDHDNNYFHWLIECLPKLVYIDELKQFWEMPLLIPADLHENLIAALMRVNIHNHPIIYLEYGVAYHVDRLIFPSPLSRILDRYMGPPVFDMDIIISRKWVSRVVDLIKTGMQHSGKPWRKLYLTRKKGMRVLGNHSEIELMLSEQGFEIVDLDKVSLDFQIQLFSQASFVVAPTGAALTNMLFCQPGTKVVVLMSNHETTNYYFWSSLGSIVGLDVTTIIGDRLFNLTNYYSVHDDYVINSNTLFEVIKEYGQ